MTILSIILIRCSISRLLRCSRPSSTELVVKKSTSRSNSCVLESEVGDKEKIISSAEANSKCGAGTVFDSDTNSCVLDR